MKRYGKIILLLFAVMLLTLALCGCGGQKAADNPADKQANTGQTVNTLPDDQETPVEGKTLVAYFSATGSTKAVAETIAAELNADLFELVPEEAYTAEDLNWRDDASRVVYEHEHPEAQAVKLTAAAPDNWGDYDTVFVGYPIWWGIAAWPVNDFVKSNDFAGKTVIPFCTSASSGLGESGSLLAEMATGGDWQTGQRFASGVDAADVAAWLDGLNMNN